MPKANLKRVEQLLRQERDGAALDAFEAFLERPEVEGAFKIGALNSLLDLMDEIRGKDVLRQHLRRLRVFVDRVYALPPGLPSTVDHEERGAKE
jgi:hypothetical protein